MLVRKLKDLFVAAKASSKTIVMLACRVVLPPELEREITVLDFSLPSKEQMGAVLDGIAQQLGFVTPLSLFQQACQIEQARIPEEWFLERSAAGNQFLDLVHLAGDNSSRIWR